MSQGFITSDPITPDASSPCEKKKDSNHPSNSGLATNVSYSVRSAYTNHNSLDHLIRLSSWLKVPRSPRRHISDMMYIEHYENGGGYALHSYADELAHLTKDELGILAKKYFKTLFTERRKRGVSVPFSYYCIGVVHGAARRLPEFLSYLSSYYPNLIVSTNELERKNESVTMSMAEYAKNVFKNYANGIYRYGPMHALSLVGVKGEERGRLCSDILEMIDVDPFLNLVTPWGQLSSLNGMDAEESNDGPILWARHGEQTVPVFTKSSKKKKSAKDNCKLTDLLTPRRIMNGRQVLVADRTPCHADHADDGFSRHTTAAIGLLKAIYPQSNDSKSSSSIHDSTNEVKQSNPVNCYSCKETKSARIVKDVVVFDPRHYPDLVERLHLDIMEPPASQCGTFWADDGELNQLHSEGFRYVRLPLRDNDIYFIPRNVVHQFKTVSAVVSIAWHVRLKNYYDQSQDGENNNNNNNSNNTNAAKTHFDASTTTTTTTTTTSTATITTQVDNFTCSVVNALPIKDNGLDDQACTHSITTDNAVTVESSDRPTNADTSKLDTDSFDYPVKKSKLSSPESDV